MIVNVVWCNEGQGRPRHLLRKRFINKWEHREDTPGSFKGAGDRAAATRDDRGRAAAATSRT